MSTFRVEIAITDHRGARASRKFELVADGRHTAGTLIPLIQRALKDKAAQKHLWAGGERPY